MLSNTMPELTEQELAHKGTHTVEYWDEKVKSYVSAKYRSIECFFFHAGIDDAASKEAAMGFINNTGDLQVLNTKTGRYARIIL